MKMWHRRHTQYELTLNSSRRHKNFYWYKHQALADIKPHVAEMIQFFFCRPENITGIGACDDVTSNFPFSRNDLQRLLFLAGLNYKGVKSLLHLSLPLQVF